MNNSRAEIKSPHNDYRLLNFDNLTPMYQHYVNIKREYSYALLLYRVGDFFECFFQDAVTVSKEAGTVLTSKEAGKKVGRIALTGFPHHSLDRYAKLLIDKGYSIAICDQVEDSSKAFAQGRMVERRVTKLLTPGTLMDDELLIPENNNFLVALIVRGNSWGLAYADVSTGEFYTTQNTELSNLNSELLRLQPAEIIVSVNIVDSGKVMRPGEKSLSFIDTLPDCFCYSLRAKTTFDLDIAKEKLLSIFNVNSIEGMGCHSLPLAVSAAGGLLKYIEDTQIGQQLTLQLPKNYNLNDFLIIDYQTRRNLEITKTIKDSTFKGSLLSIIQKPKTAMGARNLQRWLIEPLLDIETIIERHNTVEELVENVELRHDLKQLLASIHDLERISTKITSETANARHLSYLANSLLKLKDISQFASRGKSFYFKALQNMPKRLKELGIYIHNHLTESLPIKLKEGGIIKDGVNTDLDSMRRQIEDDYKWLSNLELREKQKTGISTLKVGYSKSFGFYLSLPLSKSGQVPDYFIRKQTLANEERFITPELKEREVRILSAQKNVEKLEYEIFIKLRSEVAKESHTICQIAKSIAAIDILLSFATTAVNKDYCRPQILQSQSLKVTDGRHPVVEALLPFGSFVPNSVALESSEKILEEPNLIILTGPNSSGKSCYLRQIGIIQLLAQAGSFVPAASAKLGITDRIFTRVGAVDDLATGQSTFMVEMNETANILNHATEQSLILLDEVGRGTSTFDGLSIAWAIAEYLSKEIKGKTIFATHYHELNELASQVPKIANFQTIVEEKPNSLIFLHQIRPGGASKSYGIEVAKLAGLPSSVTIRAKKIMDKVSQSSRIILKLNELEKNN